jgi:hypothetical protein
VWVLLALVICPAPAGAQGVSLAFTVQPPPNGVAGQALAPAIEVEILDPAGKIERKAFDVITLSISANPGGATLGGTFTVTASKGLAVFSGVTLDKAASGYTLTASAPGLTSATSTLFSIVAGAPARTAFTPVPTPVRAGVPFAPSVAVQIQDAYGNHVTNATNAVTLSFGTNPSGGTLLGTLTRNATSGAATFSDLLITAAAAGYSLNATATGLTSSTSSSFDITAGLPAGLRVIAQPAGGEALGPITPGVTVGFQDAYGNPLSAGTDTITAALASGPAGATLDGTLSAAAAGGVATFNNLRVGPIGSGFSLQFTAPGLSQATSTTFSVTAGAPAALAFHPQPEYSPGAQFCSAPTPPIASAGWGLPIASGDIRIAFGSAAWKSLFSSPPATPRRHSRCASKTHTVIRLMLQV